jgi:hypothetical protein
MFGAARPQSSPQQSTVTQSCCSVADAKSEVQALIATFKQDLDYVLSTTFGSSASTTPAPSERAATPITINPALCVLPSRLPPPPALPVMPPSIPSLHQVPGASTKWCATCAKSFEGMFFLGGSNLYFDDLEWHRRMVPMRPMSCLCYGMHVLTDYRSFLTPTHSALSALIGANLPMFIASSTI